MTLSIFIIINYAIKRRSNSLLSKDYKEIVKTFLQLYPRSLIELLRLWILLQYMEHFLGFYFNKIVNET